MSALDFFRRGDREAPPEVSREGIFSVGSNCCAIARAHRVALLIDGEEYFRAFALAAEQATRSIVILSWDFNSRAQLRFDGESAAPSQLGDFLNWLVRRRRGLHIHVLDWDYPLVFGTDREFRAPWGFGWRPHRRVHMSYDNTHPVGASHHQKIVVIDDALAFIGGLDLTVRRWDTCQHAADDERRQSNGSPYPPFHDLMMAVDGPAAHALGQVARRRWHAATHRHLPRLPHNLPAPWPESLPVDLRKVNVAIARTLPGNKDDAPVNEVEQLYLDMIKTARRSIYIENQYFTAHEIGEALEASLSLPEGPEIVVVVRCFSHGWLEEYTMHVLRARLVRHLREADRYGRFHIYYPHRDGLCEGTCIDLHSKLMIVDDEIVRIGSSNLSNRSMGMDTECDAAIAALGRREVVEVIANFRNRLLAEHLDCEPSAVAAAIAEHGSLHGAIDALSQGERRMSKLEDLPEWSETVIGLASIGDPAKPVSVDTLIDEFSPERLVSDDDEVDAESATGWQRLRPRLLRFGAIAAVVALLAGLWRYTPLSAWIDADRIGTWAEAFADRPWAPLVILLAYTPACLVMFPRSLITLAAVVAFGPRLGFIYALVGILISAVVTYIAGLFIPRRQVRKMAGKRLLRLADAVRRRGLLAMTALRLVPIAPFAVINVVAAAIGVHLLPFLLGTLFGMLPGTLAATIFGDQLEVAMRDFSRVNYFALAGVAVGIGLLSLAVRRWLVVAHRQPHGNAGKRAR